MREPSLPTDTTSSARAAAPVRPPERAGVEVPPPATECCAVPACLCTGLRVTSERQSGRRLRD